MLPGFLARGGGCGYLLLPSPCVVQEAEKLYTQAANRDRIITSQEDKHQAVFEYYEGLLDKTEARTSTLNLDTFFQLAHDLSSLDDPFTEE